MTRPASPTSGGSAELKRALSSVRRVLVGVGAMTALINILYLTGSFYMLEIYDRVIPSRSIPTLLAISTLALVLYGFQAVLDILRSRVLVRVGLYLDSVLSPGAFRAGVNASVRLPGSGEAQQPLRDLEQVRAFMSSLGPTALFDLPWLPLYLGICFLFHPLIGLTAMAGGIVLIALTLCTEIYTRGPTREAGQHGTARSGLAEASRRNAEVLTALGMTGRMARRWGAANESYQAGQKRVADVTGGFGAVSKIVRMVLQSAVLAMGAYLVINGQASAGVIIASSILTSRALAPVELAIAHWKGFVAARQSWARLTRSLDLFATRAEPIDLPAPSSTVAVENISAGPPGANRVTVSDLTFGLKAGQGLGVIGASASGKSSVARVLVGVWPALRGHVRLDGAALDQWDPEKLGASLGYLPQDVELFAGTVADNIARFEPEPEAEAVVAAAKAAGVHDLILRLPNGYETEIGEGGTALSAGQRQRIALARALFRDPFLVVLDEPNSNLDADGDAALTQAILGIRARGGIAIVIAHRPSVLAGVDHVLVMAGGKAQAFGPRDEVLAKVLRPAAAATSPKVVPMPTTATG